MSRSLSFVLAVVATITAPSVGLGDLLFDGAEFQINTFTPFLQRGQTARSVARATDGSFVVVWDSFYPSGDFYNVHGQRFDSAGAPAGTEFQVNSYTTSYQNDPAVSVAADGSFVVVWDSYAQDGSDRGVFGQRFDSAGAPAGTEFPVNSYTTLSQRAATVSAGPGGGFVVVWHSNASQDGSSYSVHGQRFDSAGAATGTEFQVNSFTAGGQYFAAVSNGAADGSFVVVWQNNSEVSGRRFDSAGAAVGTEFQVNSYTTNFQGVPALSAMPDGSFVVAWESNDQDGDFNSVHGQRFDSAGAAAGTEFQVNSYTTSYQAGPAVSAAAAGSFVVVWHSHTQDGSAFGVHGQRFDSAGAPAGTEFQVNSFTAGSQFFPSIAADAAGDFVVVWTSGYNQDGSSDGMFGQLLCQDADTDLICDSQETTTTTSTSTTTTSITTSTTSTTSTSTSTSTTMTAATTSTTTTTLPSAASCAPTPAAGCITGAKVSFQLKDSTDDKDQIKWKLSKGGMVDQVQLGNPATTRAYALCIYDETAGAPELVGSLTIDPNAVWDDKDPKGFSYKDKAGAEDGVTKASLRTGAAGKSAASVSARGTNIPMPAPLNMTEFFDIDTAVTVQLVNDETSLCWTSEFTAATKNDGAQFKAKAP